MSLTLVPMATDQLDDLLEIEALCFSRGWSRVTLQAILDDPNSYFITALKENRPVGYAGIHWVLDECNLDNIAVHPSYQRQGIGETLLEQLVAFSKEQQMTLMMLEVREGDLGAQELYKNFGFEPVGRRGDYYTHPTEAALLMNLQLLKEDPKE